MVSVAQAKPRVCAVILNWNRPRDTLECLDSLLPLIRCQKLALVVCDNASSDDSVGQITSWAKDHYRLRLPPDLPTPGDSVSIGHWSFLLVQPGANLGYGGGNNVGIRYALERSQFDYLWILNNDTAVHEHALDALLECAYKDPRAGALGSTLVDFFDRDVVQVAGGCRYFPLTTVMTNNHSGRPLSEVVSVNGTNEIDYISGAAMFCRTEMFRKVGLFDEQFFLYYEEIDLARRMKAAGYALSWCKESIVFHKGGCSTGSRSRGNRKESWRSNYHENLSTLLYTRKHHPNLLPAAAILRLLGKTLAYLSPGRLRLLSALNKAYLDAFVRDSPARWRAGQQPRILQIGCTQSPIALVPHEKTDSADRTAAAIPDPPHQSDHRAALTGTTKLNWLR